MHLSSLMTLPGKFIGGFSGIVVDGFGYDIFRVRVGTRFTSNISLYLFSKSCSAQKRVTNFSPRNLAPKRSGSCWYDEFTVPPLGFLIVVNWVK